MTGSAETYIQAAHTTAHHAKYFAWELTRRRAASEEDRLVQSLFDASVDLNPHQIDAALFALKNPISKGVVLADEVGLGKTIEAALVLCQLWAMLAELLLKHGLGALGVHAISAPKQVAGATVHRVLMPDVQPMWRCFEPYTEALKDEIVKARPAQVVLLNSCFVGDKADEQLANLKLELAGLDIGLTVI